MQDLTLFIANHLALTYSLAVVLILLLIVESLRAKRNTTTVTTATAVQLINRDNAVVIDLRPQDAYRKGHILDAYALSAKEIQEGSKKIEKLKTKPIILVCSTGQESQKIAALLTKQGYTSYSLLGGMRSWMDADLPLIKEGK